MSPAVAIRASSIPSPLASFLSGTARGTTLATFERSVYLDLGGRIVVLGSADLGRGPLTILLRGPGAVPRIPEGAGVTLAGGELRADSIAVGLRRVELWNPQLPPPVRVPDALMAASREAVIAELLRSAPGESIAPLLAPTPRGGALLEALGRGLAEIDELLSGRQTPAESLPGIAQEIAGRGPGLTPSGDDLLVGILMALEVWPHLARLSDARKVRDLFVEAAGPRTTRISGAYLDAARQGFAAEPWHVLIRSLGGPPDATRAAAQRILRIGETSGADTLTGFCWAWRRACP